MDWAIHFIRASQSSDYPASGFSASFGALALGPDPSDPTTIVDPSTGVVTTKPSDPKAVGTIQTSGPVVTVPPASAGITLSEIMALAKNPYVLAAMLIGGGLITWKLLGVFGESAKALGGQAVRYAPLMLA
jgi:hypothetical protein